MPLTITGFGPFPPFVINPSEVLVRSLGKGYNFKIIPTTFKAVDAYVETIGDETTLLAFGVDGEAKGFHLETLARNCVTSRKVDADGCLSYDQVIDDDGPEALKTHIDYERIRLTLEERGLPVTLSDNAGDYLCNYFYYKGLQHTSMLFVHIPMIEELVPFYQVAVPDQEFEFVMTLEEMLEGARVIVEAIEA